MLVLVVEDDPDYADIITQTLKRESHEVVAVDSVEGARRFTTHKTPDLIVLDVMLPDGTGLEVCRELRQGASTPPVIFLSSLDRSSDVIAGLNEGADDYVTKPFHPGELLARVRAVVRRAGAGAAEKEEPAPVVEPGLYVDVANQAAYYDGTNLNCTRLEIEILAQLAAYSGQPLSHEFLSEQVWGYKNVHDATLLKGHLSSIRRKLRDAGGDPELIRTVHGVGYALVAA